MRPGLGSGGGIRTRAFAAFLVVIGAGAGGCGPGLYVIDILPASSVVHQADQAGAAEWSPYEYWTAREYLQKAAEEANEGNYQDAIRFAERAAEMGRLAQEQTRERRQVEAERARAAATAGGETEQ